jgi:TonB family protein
MSIRQTLFGIALLVTSSAVFAQTTQTKPAHQPQPNSSATLDPNPCETKAVRQTGMKALQQVEILTDTMGADFGPYMTAVVKTVRQNWYNILPPSVYPPSLKQGKVSIEFVIQKDGKTAGIVMYTASGDVVLDRTAWGSITASSPFPPLPKEFPGQILRLRFYFYYNLEPSHISISPCVDVRVPAGSTLQFSASGEGITDSSITWIVSGSGCSKSACGNISDTGLYTAPANIPVPPTVNVEATSRTDTIIRGKSKLTVVQANPSH